MANPMATSFTAGGRSIVALLYLFGVASMALIGILSPLREHVAATLHAPQAAFGLTVALFSLPAALTATFGGSLIDRIGPHRVLIAAPLLMAVGDLLLVVAPSLLPFDAGMVLIGIGFVGVVISVPAMMIAVLDGPLRVRGMAFWSTFSPTGFSVGLLLAVPFTGTADWRLAIVLHGAVMLALACAAALLLPSCPASGMAQATDESPRVRVARLFVALRDPAAMRLTIAMAMPNMISYGTSLVAVTYLSNVHGVSLAASAATVAIAKIVAMLLGGTVVGALLAGRMAPRRLFVAVVAVGMTAQAMLYLPASPLPVAVAGLMLWLFAFGGLSGVGMAMMPSLARPGMGGGAIAGLLNQGISIVSFLTPTIYFALPDWGGFVAVAVGGLLVSLLALPLPRSSRKRSGDQPATAPVEKGNPAAAAAVLGEPA